MNRYRRRAALCRAVSSAARNHAYRCEPLEQRMLLDGDPILVLTEPFNVTTWPDTVNETTVLPWLWENAGEFLWDLSEPNWNLVDGDGNGYADDARGWNFSDQLMGSPNILRNGVEGAHGATIVGKVLSALEDAGLYGYGERVRIMHVIGIGSEITQYVIEQKALDANIVAVSNSTEVGFSRADVALLGANDILFFPAFGAAPGMSLDPDPGAPDAHPFYHATPRRGTQLEPVHTIIPVTTDPAVSDPDTDYGINSFYFSAPGHIGNGTNPPTVEQPSYAAPLAATYAAIAAQAYQDEHDGDTPNGLQIKRAMMGGLVYQENLENKTISHDFAGGGRVKGGVLDLGSIIDAINDDGPGITGVSMTPAPPTFNKYDFDLNSSVPPTNWTISWGDNSFSDGSGIQVVPGNLDSRPHAYPFENNISHKYYPTIYAMLGTGDGRQVYLQSLQREVIVSSGAFAATSGPDHYTLSRDGDDTVLTLVNSNGTTSHPFAPTDLQTCLLKLGEGDDTLTINLTNGNPLEQTALTVSGTTGQDNLLSIIGSSGVDTISVLSGTVFVEATVMKVDAALDLYIDGAGGNDVLTSSSLQPVTLAGGAGNDTLNLPIGKSVPSETLDGGDGVDTVIGISGPEAQDQAVEYFTTTSGSTTFVKRYDETNLLLFHLVRTSTGHTTLNVDDALFGITIDHLHKFRYGAGSDLVPISSVSELLVNGQNKDESFDIESIVDVTVTAGGGDDSIIIIAPNATILGGDGDDSIYTGDTGSYRAEPGSGSNYFHGGDSTDYVLLASGANDIIWLGSGDDTVDARNDLTDNDYINGGLGFDTLIVETGYFRPSAVSIEEIEEV